MTLNNRSYQEWKDRANEGSLSSVAQMFGAKLKRGREQVGPCPQCGGVDRLGVNDAKQSWICRGGGAGHDRVSLAMHIGALSFVQACEQLTGEAPPNGKSKPLSDADKQRRAEQRAASEVAQRQREAEQEAYEDQTTAAALAIWNASGPVEDSLAETYLHARGLPTPEAGWPEVLRCHTALPYPGKGKFPALVCKVTDVDDEFTAIWRIYLSADGKSKADLEFAKLGLGPAGGAAVRLGPAGPHVGLCEGLETGLAVLAMNEMAGLRYPIWPALSTSGLIAIELPLTVERITIFPDGDSSIRKKDGIYIPVDVPPGRKAALALKDRLIGEGVKCSLAAEPSPGRDYCDLWNASQREVA